MMVGRYDEPREDGRVDVHVGFDIGDQAAPVSDGIEVVELPVVEVASVVHRGTMAGVGEVYERMIRWIEDSGHRLDGYSRELYLETDDGVPSVTELQLPIAG
jgi:effector-binding domain-containing protein